MAEVPLARLRPRERPTETLPTVPDGARDLVAPGHRRASPPEFEALDEATLRERFAPILALRGAWGAGAAEFERAARLPGLAAIHPFQPPETIQGVLEVVHQTARSLSAITGLEAFSLQPATVRDAQRAALLVVRAVYERAQPGRVEVVAPGGETILEVAEELGLKPVEIGRLPGGELDLDSLADVMGEATMVVAAPWLKPSGGFDANVAAAADVAHVHGALMCVDASGWRALLGAVRVRDVGADLAWLPLGELTPLATAVALGVRSELTEALPTPLVGKERGGFILDGDLPRTIGRMALAPARFPDVLAFYIALRTLGAPEP